MDRGGEVRKETPIKLRAPGAWLPDCPCVVLFLVFVSSLHAQNSPGALEILRKVEGLYRGVSQYEVEVESSNGLDPGEEPLSMRVQFKSPNKYRIEVSGGLNPRGNNPVPTMAGVMVFDGSTWWGYSPGAGEYHSASTSPIDGDSMGFGPYRDLLESFNRDNGKSIRAIGEVRLSTGDGREHQCLVVELAYPQEVTTRLWVEKSTYHILRMETKGGTVTYRNIQLGIVLKDDVFRFTPPPGARKVENP
jgi:outer membrane lipoprotein-sorting protein